MSDIRQADSWKGSLWLRHGEGKVVLLHDPRPATKMDMRRCGIMETRAAKYITGCVHGTSYRGVYSRDYIAGEAID